MLEIKEVNLWFEGLLSDEYLIVIEAIDKFEYYIL